MANYLLHINPFTPNSNQFWISPAALLETYITQYGGVAIS